MDKTKKTQICLFALGLFIIGIGIYLVYLVSTYAIFFGIIIIMGIGTARLGYRYKPQDKTIKRQPKLKITSFRGILTLTGLVIFFVGLAFAYVGMVEHNMLPLAIFAIFLVISLIFIFTARLIRVEKKS